MTFKKTLLICAATLALPLSAQAQETLTLLTQILKLIGFVTAQPS